MVRRLVYAALVSMACSPRGIAVDGESVSETSSSTTEPDWGDETSTTTTPEDLPPECGADVVLESSAPHIAWVIERSTAMVQHYIDHDGDPETFDRKAWEVVRDFLIEFGSMHGDTEPCGADMETSFAFAPSLDAEPIPAASACDVDEAAPLVFNDQSDFFDLVIFAENFGSGGANPLASAHQAAVERLVEDSHGTGDYVVLVAHTPPNCGGGSYETLDSALMASVQDAYESLGIPTYVIGVGVASWTIDDTDGIPDADAIAYFEALSDAGGRPSYWDEHRYWAPDETFLAEFDPGGWGFCLFPLDPAPPDGIDESSIEVFSQGVFVPYSENCDVPEGESGWMWINEFDTIELCGTACVTHDGTCYPDPPHQRGGYEARWPCD